MLKISRFFENSIVSTTLLTLVIGMLVVGGPVTLIQAATENPYGAQNLSPDQESYTLEEMLTYAVQDEYKARAEYELIIEEMDGGRPFTNIIKSEETHISLLEPLFKTHGIELPKDKAAEYVALPDIIDEALEIGVQAEIKNIDMYDRFLSQNLPEDVENVFERLKNSSQNHLEAFKRSIDGSGRSGRGSGQCQGRGKKQG
ncbi:DUF2202 domain-containing protein [Candidatus Bipolaricaulota bacterium]|nr:DUF2202 domain-containing protein [Candidatus Bipolaricaulota bacterium]